MKDHQLWIDTLNLNIQAGKSLQEALQCADAMSVWPFKYVNGEQTGASKALEALKPVQRQRTLEKPLSAYAQVMSDPDTLEALI